MVAYSSEVHPVLFHIGAVLIPAYGAMAAVGVLAGLVLALRTARVAGVNPGHAWNLCVVAVCAALVCERLLLVAVNLGALRSHPAWALGLAMIHPPLVASVGAAAALGSGAWYARRHGMPLLATADALAAPLAVGLTFEQLGALLAGSDFGTAATVRWAVTYTSALAALWSGTPLGVPVHPVQAYAALAFLALAVITVVWLPMRRQAGDVAGMWLMGAGAAIYLTELWRDPAGRGAVLRGALDGPQIAGVAMVITGALVLREREDRAFPPFRQEEVERMGHGSASDEGKTTTGPSTPVAAATSAQDDKSKKIVQGEKSEAVAQDHGDEARA